MQICRVNSNYLPYFAKQTSRGHFSPVHVIISVIWGCIFFRHLFSVVRQLNYYLDDDLRSQLITCSAAVSICRRELELYWRLKRAEWQRRWAATKGCSHKASATGSKWAADVFIMLAIPAHYNLYVAAEEQLVRLWNADDMHGLDVTQFTDKVRKLC